MQREAYYCAARSPNTVDVVVMKQGLHNEPGKLRGEVQKALDVTTDLQGRPYDASLLGYGLCSNGIVGLSAKIPIVVPRGHDCITLLLGSKDRYKEYFDSHRGVYWFSPGWIETDNQPGKERFEKTLKEYIGKFGEDNARYLMETEQSWLNEYKWATYIDWGFANAEGEKQFTKKAAEFLKWTYDEVKGDSGLMQRLVDGHPASPSGSAEARWNEKEFLVIRPGQKIIEDLTSEGIIGASD